jgi:hypothetical protein
MQISSLFRGGRDIQEMLPDVTRTRSDNSALDTALILSTYRDIWMGAERITFIDTEPRKITSTIHLIFRIFEQTHRIERQN